MDRTFIEKHFDSFENTPIHEAAKHGHAELIKILTPFTNAENAKDDDGTDIEDDDDKDDRDDKEDYNNKKLGPTPIVQSEKVLKVIASGFSITAVLVAQTLSS